MNIVLAAYYGDIPADKLPSNVDVSHPLALKRVWDATHQGGVKISSIATDRQAEIFGDIQLLGGMEKASQLLEEARDWLETWSDADAMGRKVAQELAWEQFGQDAPQT